MSWFIHHCGEHSNRTYSEIYEYTYAPGAVIPFDRYGPYPTREEAEKAAKRRGLTLTSLKDTHK